MAGIDWTLHVRVSYLPAGSEGAGDYVADPQMAGVVRWHGERIKDESPGVSKDIRHVTRSQKVLVNVVR
ncbi:MAG: hypothetical protein FJ276_09355 [Planctomycetes bacterium]|nr:hypothetical protein [Planctomycetota bacterium]